MRRPLIAVSPENHEWAVTRAKNLGITIQDLTAAIFDQARNSRMDITQNNIIKNKLAAELHKLNQKKQAIIDAEENIRKQLQSHMRTLNLANPHVIESGDYGDPTHEQLSLDPTFKNR